MSASQSASIRLPVPETGRDEAERFVATHFDGLYLETEVVSSDRFRGGQSSAEQALERFDVAGYAANRNEAFPAPRRGASGLSPYIRHGLLSLRRVWDAVDGGPPQDVMKFRDELLWQEYARHWYARLGPATAAPLRRRFTTVNPVPDAAPASASDSDSDSAPASGAAPASAAVDVDPDTADFDSELDSFDLDSFDFDSAVPPGWDQDMACLELTIGELEDDGYLVNQTRMWLASHWTVRNGLPWRDGEDYFFRHLLDGSRAANRLGWQWTSGIGSDRAYGFSRWQVERRAPGLCASCEVAVDCPIYSWPDDAEQEKVEANPLIGSDPDLARTIGPRKITAEGTPEVVWLTAESLGMADPALVDNPDLVVVFVFDEPLLRRLQLSSKRLVFLVETLAELALHRPFEVHLGDPVSVLSARPAAATFTPVPGWQQRASSLSVVKVHPWPWLRVPIAGSIGSYSAWSKQIGRG